MRTISVLMFVLAAAVAHGGITARELAKYQENNSYSHDEADPGPEEQIRSRLMKATAARIPAEARSLAEAWKVPEAAAAAALEAVVAQNAWDWDHAPGALKRVDALLDLAARSAPHSHPVWEMRLNWSTLQKRCDASLRTDFFAEPFVKDLVELEVCKNWLPEYLHDHPRDVAAWDAFDRYILPTSRAAALAANSMALDVGGGARDRAPDDVVLYLLRRRMALLDGGDLPRDVRALVDGLPAPWRADVLGREITQDVRIGAYRFASATYGMPSVADARSQYVLALLDAGELPTARAAIVAFDMPRGTTAHKGAAGRDSQVFAEVGADSAEFLRDLTAESLDVDLFERYVGDGQQGLLWGPATDSAAARRLGARLMRAHGLGSVADFLASQRCIDRNYDGDDPAPDPDWRASLSASFRERDATLDARLATAAAASRADCPTAAGNPRRLSTQLPSWPEVKLTAEQKKAPAIPNYHGALPIPDGFRLVRAEKSGPRIAALCQSSAVDPAGEISGGGYWLLLSKDGKNFGDPLYLGFQALHPYELLEKARVPLLAGDVLHIEARVRELDPESISFPPVGLSARRKVDDLYLEIPLAALEKDSDGDGLPNLLEGRIATDPANRDTDGDGIGDGEDDFPQVSARGPMNPLGELVADLLKRIAGFERAGYIEPLREPGQTLSETLGQVRRADSSRQFRFIQGDPALFVGLHLGGDQALILSDAQVDELGAHYGPTFPLAFPTILVDEKQQRAIVHWSASWTGGTLRFTRKNGKWEAEVVSSWIT